MAQINIFKVMKGKNLQPRMLHPERLSIRIEGEIKNVIDQQKLREFITNNLALQEMLKGLF